MSALTPQSDMPTPTTDKITQAAMETIYLCKFRVSMDGEWLCLRELDDISLTPDPEPTHEDSWEDLTDVVEQLRDDTEGACHANIFQLLFPLTIEYDNPVCNYLYLHIRYIPLFNNISCILRCRNLTPNRVINVICECAFQYMCNCVGFGLCRTPAGRGRAWLRLALMQKKLSEYMKALINRKDLLSEFYEPNALMMEEEGAIIAGLLVGLNVIDANFCMKGEDLDSQVGVIDFSMYLKDGNSTKGSEGDGQITAILDQKNYVEELNRHLRIITLQEEMERVKEESSYILESNRKVTKDRTADGQALTEARKQLKEETQLRLDVEKELEAQIGMRQEMELAMKMLEKDVCEKQDALVALRQQLDDLRALKHELSFKLQSSDMGVKQKSELNSRLEEKTNQMAATIKQLEQSEKDLVKQAKTLNSAANKLIQKHH
uniref:RUN and FYVE domain containing 3 n=1 Tax=Pavo cristatus TaxID=9049 RepID=A0A8C9EQY0_PAVCR